MKRYMKKGIAWILSLVMAMSTLTCLAMAADDENAEGEPGVTVRITCNLDELRPGDKVNVTYWLAAPVEGVTSLTITAATPDGLTYQNMYSLVTMNDLFWFPTDEGAPEGAEGGEVAKGYGSPPEIKAWAYNNESARAFEEDLRLFTITYEVSDDVEEVTFELEDVSVSLVGARNVEVKVDSDPIRIIVVDTSALEARLAAAKSLVTLTSVYTEKSLADLEEAIAAADEILENIHSYYQEDVDAALEALNTAYDNLKKIEDEEAENASRAELEEALEAAKQLNEADYTEDSWAVLQAAIETVEEVLGNEDATQEELNNAADVLAEAVEGLVPVGGSSVSGGTTGATGTTGTTGTSGTSGTTTTSPQTSDSNTLILCLMILSAGTCMCAVWFTFKARKAEE